MCNGGGWVYYIDSEFRVLSQARSHFKYQLQNSDLPHFVVSPEYAVYAGAVWDVSQPEPFRVAQFCASETQPCWGCLMGQTVVCIDNQFQMFVYDPSNIEKTPATHAVQLNTVGSSVEFD